MGSCNDFCVPKEEIYRDSIEVLKEKGGEISVKCEICAEQMSNRSIS